MAWLADQDVAYVDASTFCRLAECDDVQALWTFSSHAGERIKIVSEVARELTGLANDPKFQRLTGLKLVPPPGQFCHHAPSDTQPHPDQVERLARAVGVGNGSPTRKNFGEAATILQAGTDGTSVVLDERAAIKVAQQRGLVICTTRDVVVELVEEGQMTDAHGLAIWKIVYPNYEPHQLAFNESRDQYRSR